MMRPRQAPPCVAVMIACWVAACSSGTTPSLVADDAAGAGAGANDAGRSEGDAERPAFCAREAADAVYDAFCSGETPAIRGLRELQVLLALAPGEDAPDPSALPPGAVPDTQLTSVAALSHSTALSGHLVSAINPRVIVMGNATFMAFQRGEQRVELISRARDRDGLDFYLLEFEQRCNDRPSGCGPGDLYTPRIESDWLRVQIRDGQELENTPVDCRTCHQRASDHANLLMRELESPWTHFFFPAGISSSAPGVTGSDLMADYLNAKGDETYAGFPLRMISAISPFFLQTLVGSQQPLLFDAPQIENERYPYGPDGYAKEALPSPTWESAYEAWKRGEQLALPYLEPRASDPGKLAALSEAYRRYGANEISADELPDLSDVFPDDPHERARRGLQTEPEATPQDALIQACGSCHNDVLDQGISRARFNIAVARLDRAELDLAIERIQRAPGSDGAMPPREVRQLDPGARERLNEYLRNPTAELDPDGRLDQAARIGMTGGGGIRNSGAGAL